MNSKSRPALFCDRDGNLIVEKNYISDPAQVELIPGVADALRRARLAGYLLIVVTNQSGIARGLLSEAQARAVNDHLHRLLSAQGVELDAIYFCPHHPDHGSPCSCRKPARGMVDRACSQFEIDLERSWVIGDRIPDMRLSANVGAKRVMVRTGYGAEESQHLPPELFATPVVDHFAQAVTYILKEDQT